MSSPPNVSFAYFGFLVLLLLAVAAVVGFFAREALFRAASTISRFSAALGAFDIAAVDHIMVGGAARLLRVISRFAASLDAWVVAGVVQIVAGTIWAISIPVRMIQTGSLRGYMFAMTIGLIGFLGYYLYLARHSIR
jgi:hypothetical protein